jgi:D-alanyl-D-alanine carboxypeptidase
VSKTPPREDEQPEYQTPRRRRPPVTYRRPPTDYTEDDRPEIPKIRRASRTPYQFPESITKDQGRTQQQKGAQQQQPDTIMVARKRPSSVYTPPPPAHRTQRDLPKRTQRDRLVYLRASQPVIILCVLLFVIVVIGAIIANAVHFLSPTQSTVITTGTTNNHPGAPPSGIQHSGNPHELVIIPQDTDHPPPTVSATSAYLLDADTGATLYAYHPFMHLPMMSTTKLMTAVLAVEQGNLDQSITITHAMANDISKLSADSTVVGIKEGDTYTLRDLLYGLLLKSGNDAAIAIADSLAGDLPHFVAEMNQRAKQLSLYDTHYMNPHGLLATGHYSSAHDLAILGQFSLSNPIIHKISGTQTYIISKGGNHPIIPLLNGNQFLFWYPGVDSGKPGFDGVSNFVQVISTTRNHHRLIGVTMHTNNWWTDMRDLMNWGFDNFKWVSPRDLDTAQNPIPFDYLWNYFASDKKENTLPTANGGRYYIYTGYSISGPIMTYYDKGGGLKQFGYPISLPNVSSSAAISQRFEKVTIQCNLTSKQCNSQ